MHLKYNVDGPTIMNHGLTKREYFAAMAMQGFMSTFNNDLQAEAILLTAKEKHISTSALIAQMSIVHADALIAELEKK